MTPSQNAERLIKRCEGCGQRTSTGTLRSYPDPGTGGAPWTIGYGSTGPGIGRGTEWTQAQADARFTQDLTEFAAKVQEAVGSSDTTQGQFDASTKRATSQEPRLSSPNGTKPPAKCFPVSPNDAPQKRPCTAGPLT